MPEITLQKITLSGGVGPRRRSPGARLRDSRIPSRAARTGAAFGCLLLACWLLAAIPAAAAGPSWQSYVPPMSARAQALERLGYLLFGLGLLMRALFFGLLLTGGRAARLQDRVEALVRPPGIKEPAAVLALLLLYRLTLLPIAYLGYRVDRAYGIAVQSNARWALDTVRGEGINLLVLLPMLLLLLWAVRRWPRTWWLGAAVVSSALAAFLIYLSPLVIDPLFHRFIPLQNHPLSAAILNLANRAGVHVKGVFVGEFSATTTEGNAYVTGLGSSHRIVLWDTILKRYTPGELQSIVAHELGHYALGHILKGLLLGAAGSFLLFFLIHLLMGRGTRAGWLRRAGEPAALPLIAAAVVVLNLLGMPVMNWVSRAMESQADAFSLRMTGRPDWFIESMQQLCIQDYNDPSPPPALEFIFDTHPSTAHRIQAAADYARRHHLSLAGVPRFNTQ